MPGARIGLDLLESAFEADRDTEGQGSKWGLAFRPTAASDQNHAQRLIKMAVDRRHGSNRIPFVYALARLHDPWADAALDELAKDVDLSVHIARAKQGNSMPQ